MSSKSLRRALKMIIRAKAQALEEFPYGYQKDTRSILKMIVMAKTRSLKDGLEGSWRVFKRMTIRAN